MTDNLLRASVNFPYFFNFKDHFGDVPKKKKKKKIILGIYEFDSYGAYRPCIGAASCG